VKLALTYDDGPNAPATLDLLEVLAKHDVKATFFMLGQFVFQRPDIAQAVKDAGHQIGNHTYSHPALPTLSLRCVKKELEDCEAALNDAVGTHSGWFRPPFILSSPGIENVVESLGLRTILIHAAAGDAVQQGADFHADKIDRELKNESGIILMHDGGHLAMGAPRRDTIEATDKMITRYKAAGAEFVFPTEI
jgi:peptidoglycan/xylan/chitin deacetylase (PgdA/CDA1 family)